MEAFVFYDVPDDRLRAKVMSACRDYGLRWLQYSGFRGALPPARRNELAARMRLLVGKGKGFVVIVPVCERDVERVVEIGCDAPLGGRSAALRRDRHLIRALRALGDD